MAPASVSLQLTFRSQFSSHSQSRSNYLTTRASYPPSPLLLGARLLQKSSRLSFSALKLNQSSGTSNVSTLASCNAVKNHFSGLNKTYVKFKPPCAIDWVSMGEVRLFSSTKSHGHSGHVHRSQRSVHTFADVNSSNVNHKISSTVDEALLRSGLKDGMTVLAGGFGMCGVPVALIEGVKRANTKDLTVVRSVNDQSTVLN